MWTDAQLLLLIAALLYLSECVVRLPPQSALLLDAGRRGWRRARRVLETGGRGFAFALLPPWPWGTRSVVVSPEPVSASPDLVSGFVAAQYGPLPRPEQPEGLARIQELGGVRSALREIRVGDGLLARAADDIQARATAVELDELAALPDRSRRESALRTRARRSVDAKRAAERLAEVRREAQPVEICARVLFVWLYAVVPALAFWLGTERILPGVLAATPLLHLPLAWLFFRAHRRLLPEARHEAWTEVFKCVLSPPLAVRAPDYLWLRSFRGFHPIALLLAGGREDELQAEARREWLDLRYPAFPADIPESARACEQWHRDTLRKELETALCKAGIAVESLFPAPSDNTCPRCAESLPPGNAPCPSCGTPRADEPDA